ncbi:MAG TPA: tRNA (guanosine(37)-N1)-methyltransferase TrmD [Candidatus Scatosoma pullistercoris]|uniref:tRNA (guanine-N(1)-)-methyltransferase n=1 Tax=Candidatus Scatosoma pullistercoris TaxID=2840934 RepID=A0A9D1MFM2_9FIRM|nr:tRNA (guanosine(37)-N1)-methyltransferase TrmD [Candidatus Scatosoma pullistercoris]
MKIDILTLFPEMFSALGESILGRAQKAGKIEINVVNIRDFTEDKHLKCDDYPFGGGAGMVMMPQPIGSAIDALDKDRKAHRIYLSPKGETLRQQKVFSLLAYEHLILLCGHYEGVDQRVIDLFIDEEISIGDYVLTGGELPAMVLVDCVSRYVDGVISTSSLVDESFSDGLLEYPQYTRPQEYRGLIVPPVLVSGDHAKVDEWRRKEALKLTKKMRPDLLKK